MCIRDRCERAQRERVEEQAEELESLGARLRLGEAYLEGLDQDVIFRTPGLHPGHPALEAARARGAEAVSYTHLLHADPVAVHPLPAGGGYLHIDAGDALSLIHIWQGTPKMPYNLEKGGKPKAVDQSR